MSKWIFYVHNNMFYHCKWWIKFNKNVEHFHSILKNIIEMQKTNSSFTNNYKILQLIFY